MSAFPVPTLKPPADLQLRNAFHEGNWLQAFRLADKRAKSLKDPYIQAIAIAAQSQLGLPHDKRPVLAAIDKCVRSGTVITDAAILELYEWACHGLIDEEEYSCWHGQLRLRLVKALPKDKYTILSSLRLCLLHWDLINAQQIAAVLNKTYPSERQYHFWNIILTFLLSVTTQCTSEKQNLYSILALKQLQRAAEQTKSDHRHNRAIHTEEELLLYFRVLSRYGSAEDLSHQIKDPSLLDALSFDKSSKNFLFEAIDAFQRTGDHESIFNLCVEVLVKSDEGSLPNILGSDFSLWKRLIIAANAHRDRERALNRVCSLLEIYVVNRERLRPVYSRIITLALLEVAFCTPNLRDNVFLKGRTIRLTQLRHFIQQNHDKAACFDDLKCFIQRLSSEEAVALITEVMPSLQTKNTRQNLLLNLLSIKFRYLLSTSILTTSLFTKISPTFPARCPLCGLQTQESECQECIIQIIIDSLDTKQEFTIDSNLVRSLDGYDLDPAEELVIVAAMALLKLSQLHKRDYQALSPMSEIYMPAFLQAVALLDRQLLAKPDSPSIRMLLVNLYLLLGCASHAYCIWRPLDVKRTIQDSLSPLFFDRIASISPGLFRLGTGMQKIVEPLKAYFQNCLKLRAPSIIWDALESGNYTSVLGISSYMSKLRQSCTLVMALVEERKGLRLLYGKSVQEINRISLVSSIGPNISLEVASDYGSFPDLDGPAVKPLRDVVRLGPGLSNVRCQLDLLAERYWDIILHSSPKDHRPRNRTEMASRDTLYLLETLDRLHSSMTSYLHDPATMSALTGPEETYFTIISLLAAFTSSALHWKCSDSGIDDLSSLIDGIALALTAIRAEFENISPTRSNYVFLAFGATHAMSLMMLCAQVTKQTISFIYLQCDTQQIPTKERMASLDRTTLLQLVTLGKTTDIILETIHERIRSMKLALNEGGWIDKMAAWTFGNIAVDVKESELKELGHCGENKKRLSEKIFQVIGGLTGYETWGVKVLESWRETLEGWEVAKFG